MRACPVRQAAGVNPAGIGWVDGDQALTWSEIDRLVGRWAGWLDGQGVRPGDRVGVLAWNRVEVAALLFATGRIGASLVPLNARLTAAELAPLVYGRLRLVLAADELRDRLPGSVPFPELPAGSMPDAQIAGEVIAVGLFTSGTTGVPKLVELSHDNFRANAQASAANLGGGQNDRWLLTLPLFHVGGLAMTYRVAEYAARLVFQRSFDVAATARLIAAGEVSTVSLVATALERLLDQWGEAQFPETISSALIGGGPVPAPLLDRARRLRLPVLQTYGLTEACSQVATERPGEADGQTAGPPLPGITIKIVDNTGGHCPPGTVGEIWVQSPTVAPAYQPWLPTGDLGQLDEQGRLTVASRRVDLIVSGGENIYPAEIERALNDHPGVFESAVAPVPDSRWGQVPVAAIVPRAGFMVDEPALVQHLRSRLAGFKIPKRFVLVAELPRNALSKVDRQKLTELFEKH